MASIGTPLSPTATRLLLLGSGELGKEVAIEAQRLGVEVVAADRYANAPAMQVAHRAHVFSMLDGDALRRVVETERPHLIVPEVEAIATPTLVELESEGWRVIPPPARRASQWTGRASAASRPRSWDSGPPSTGSRTARRRSGMPLRSSGSPLS